MKKVLVTLALACLIFSDVQAQFNFSQLYNPYTQNLASAQMPSLLGDGMRRGEFYFMNLYAGFGNNMVSAFDIQQLSNSGRLTNDYIDGFLKKAPKQGNVWAGLDLPVANIFFNIHKKKKPFISIGLGMRQKFDMQFSLNNNLLSLLYKGNKQFAGETVNLSPAVNMMLYNEYFVAAATQFKLPKVGPLKNIILKPAARLRFLNGMAGIYMPQADINMYTDPDGRYIDFTTSLQANMSTAVDTPDFESALNDVSLSSFKRSGNGLGVDLGLGVTVNERLKAHIGIIDMGNIHFNKNMVNYTKNSSYRYEGVNINEEGEVVSTANLDAIIQPEKSYTPFSMPLPTRLILSAQYGMKKKTRNNIDFYKHSVGMVYVQGFRNYLSATTTPALNLGYSFNWANRMSLGVNTTLGGLNGMMAGMHWGLRFGAFKFGLASNNLLPLIYAKAGRGTDANLYFGFYF